MATKPTASWSETSPAGTDAISLGDDKIRELKTQVREVFAADHIFNSVGQAENWGYHNQVTFVEQGSNPTAVNGAIILFTKEANSHCELFCIDEDSNVIQLTQEGIFIGGMNKEVRMWSGTLATIPTGWHLCDGTHSLPNLVGKFIRGIATSVTNPGSTGGTDSNSSVNLYHSHPIDVLDGSHTHSMYFKHSAPPIAVGASIGSSISYTMTGIWYSGTDIGYEHTHDIDTVGSGTNIENRPAFYELAYIARV